MAKLFTKAFSNRLKKYPLYSQEGKGMSAIVVERFFGGNLTVYILEGDEESGRLFGLVDLGYGFEYGYFNLKDLESIRVPPFHLPLERDRYIESGKVTLGVAMMQNGEEMLH